ncbi:hypothetical protein AMAG_04446 [Allomyces macrogynus ATCC 38327]|uniref:Acyltransferase 3 domain-containing protein n=1 Tax=Allomyces macrogynus (strain ATCC 38327) TaxID=578462 RepID=A0A0L0S919_ALLM3|nr:hypothetical protein AMAG_04446 [Allomyces macrogynus ATCC 38327]|eukprot:KNE58909.1 hypothetical protein AMAG_04446 [Allomyces macrogynus ATCC 38327]
MPAPIASTRRLIPIGPDPVVVVTTSSAPAAAVAPQPVAHPPPPLPPAPAVHTPIPAASVPRMRVHYIDWIRLWLTVMVVWHHCILINVAGWWPLDKSWNVDSGSIIAGSVLLIFDQGFFMGLFFFLSGLFAGPSLARKGVTRFLKDRFLRLLLPIILYELLLAPLQLVLVSAALGIKDLTFSGIYRYYFAHYVYPNNPLWFCALLLFFELLYLVAMHATGAKPGQRRYATAPAEAFSPSQMVAWLALWSLGLGAITFIIRIYFPIGLFVPVLGQLAYLPQYLFGYIMGHLAQQRDALARAPTGACVGSSAFAAIGFAAVTAGVLSSTPETQALFTAGTSGRQLLMSVVEQAYAVTVSAAILMIFRDRYNGAPNRIWMRLIGAAYAVYIVHPLVVAPLYVPFMSWAVVGWFKWIVLFVLATLLSWLIGVAAKLVPFADRVL